MIDSSTDLRRRIAMVASQRPIGRGWCRTAAGLLVTLAVTGPTAADLTPATEPSVATTTMTEQARGKPRQAATAAPEPDGKEPDPAVKPIPKPIADAIAVLRATDINNSKRWATAARDLVRIGKPAVPYLIEELDRTTENRPLRSLGFTLRAIGDPRAVPALIRAIPRTLVPAGSDFGLNMDDPELLAFLQRHDLQKGEGGELFTFGMPYREITGALHAITGHRFHEDELNFINLDGTPKQRWLQLWLFHGLATRWAIWWKQNWQRFTDDPAYARVSLPPLPEAPPVPSASADQPFPTGDKVRASNGWANVIVGPPQAQDYYRTFKDLDTGREIKWPRELPDSSKAKADEIAAFAAREGFDLRGIEYTAPGSDRSHYAIQGFGLRAWQVDNSRYETIENDLRENKPPALDRPAGDLLMDLDPKTERHHPENQATFLFVTREGTVGILQLTGLVTEVFRGGGFGAPAGINRPDGAGAAAPVLPSAYGFYRGVQIQYKFLYAEGDAAH
jgi:hypothetical protein